MTTLTGAFRATATRCADRPALTFGSLAYTHGELDRLSDHFAAALAARGINAGDRVGVCLANGPGLVLAHLALGKLGAIRLCLDPKWTAAELTPVLDDASPSLVLVEPGADACGRESLSPAEGADPWGAPEAGPPEVALTAETPALLAYTSGTTGRPKGALHTQGSLLANISDLANLWGWTEDDRLLLALPMFHVHGLCLGLHGTLLRGGSIELHTRFEAEAVRAALRGCTMFMGVPTMYERLLRLPADAAADDLSHIRLSISGSAPLAKETWAEVKQRFGLTLLERYGLTETLINCSNPCDGERRAGAVGPPLPSVELRLVPEGEGEIQVRGPSVCSGYWERPDATAEAFTEDGFFRTGDLGRIDEAGYVVICGRSKELIITGGKNVHPREVEEALATHPSVAECAVVGVPDREWGERITGCVVLAEGAEGDEQALRDHVRERLAPYKVPKAIRFIDALPRNAMGKVRRAALIDD